MKKAILMAALATVASMPAMAQEKAPMPPEGAPPHERPMPPHDGKDMEKKGEMWFSKIDTNKDGSISKEEHQAFSDKMFAEADANKDGKISKDEMMSAKKREHEKMKKEMPPKK